MIIRQARFHDIDTILDLLDQLNQGANFRGPLKEGYVEEYLNAPQSHILVVEGVNKETTTVSTSIVGVLCYSTRPDLFHGGTVCLVENFVVMLFAKSDGIINTAFISLFMNRFSISARSCGMGISLKYPE